MVALPTRQCVTEAGSFRKEPPRAGPVVGVIFISVKGAYHLRDHVFSDEAVDECTMLKLITEGFNGGASLQETTWPRASHRRCCPIS